MSRSRVTWLGLGLLLVGGSRPALAAPQQNGEAPNLEAPGAFLQDEDNRPVKPLPEGPLHEAFLSPAKDADPVFADKGPPPEITEKPGVDPPSADAKWIPGYWEWDPIKKDFVWVTGTWRVPPPGRF